MCGAKLLIYIVPFRNDRSNYLRALYWLSRNWLDSQGLSLSAVELLGPGSISRLLTAPFRSRVLIEDIHTAALYLWLRPDLQVYHYPRGGSTLKLGWKSSGKLSLRIWLKLIRRNKIFLNSDLFCDYLADQEVTPRSRYVSAIEPVTAYLCRQKNCGSLVRRVCVALSENRLASEYLEIRSSIQHVWPDLAVFFSVHPQCENNFKACETAEILDTRNDALITDCVSAAFHYFASQRPVLIIKEAQKTDRSLFYPQDYFFGDICDIDDVGQRIISEEYSFSKVELSDRLSVLSWE